ncbi:MAG TPA: hypothetical protein EYH38_06255, partial [Leucothrix sp.]|nr:hypothetical protein [Leucothrix sp.]
MSHNSGLFCAIYASALLCFSGNVTADIFNQNALLYGHNIESGLGRDGAFGSDINSPDHGRKSFGNNLGYISDPTENRFQTSYHGDFFLPGVLEEGWGVSFDGKTYNNNSN